MARVRESQTPLPSADTAKENLKRLSQRIHQRRTRARETILFDLHQGVKTVEAQVHKQVDMVMSRLKDAPGSKYAFALTHTFLTQLPQALSNTILPSAFSAVADTVASRTTNSMTTLRGAAGEDEYDEEEEEDEEENADDQDDPDEYQQQASIRMQLPQQDSRLSLQLSSEFGTIALAKEPRTVLSQRSAASSITTFGNNNRDYNNSRHLQEAQLLNDIRSGGVSISSAGASEFLAASTQHNYSSAASQVLAAALPSFIPSMVAPIVCVFSYPSPPTTIPNSPNQSSPSSPNMPTAQVGVRDRQESDASVARNLREFSPSEDVTAARELKEAIKTDPAVAEVTATTWTKAEQEALFLVATRFRLRGQWSKIRQVMNLHRTETEIADEYRRLYGDEDSGSDEDMTSEGDDGDLVPVKREGNVEDGDADDEADVVFMRFGGKHYPNPSYRRHCIDELPSTHSMIAVSSEPRSFGSYRSEYLSGPRGPVLANDHSSPASSQNSLRVIKKEFMIDKRFTLEDIPTRL
ncbi:hypothetical protein BGZ83_000859 [Gryganskiella cystojenkinii]|nr:hypothetical protein BGZ83_000859 [Gryganskiella cystojenkinii]